MTTTAMPGVSDVEADLQRVVDDVAQHFADVTRAEIDHAVHETYARLAAAATVTSRLAAVCGACVITDLVRAGHRFGSRNA